MSVLLCLLCSCDMFRSLAGRPTSDQIEQRKVLISLRQKAEQARLDSIERAEAYAADSLAALDSIRNCGLLIKSPLTVKSLANLRFESRFCVVLGTFSEQSNADAFSAKVSVSYPSSIIRLRNGYCVVTACQSDDPVEFIALLGRIRQEKFCSKDAWVLINE